MEMGSGHHTVLNHGVTERFGLEGALKVIWFNPPPWGGWKCFRCCSRILPKWQLQVLGEFDLPATLRAWTSPRFPAELLALLQAGSPERSSPCRSVATAEPRAVSGTAMTLDQPGWASPTGLTENPLWIFFGKVFWREALRRRSFQQGRNRALPCCFFA